MSKLQEQSTDLDARRDQLFQSRGFTIAEKLGEGTSGTAFKVTNKESDECVIKEIVCRNNEHFNRIKGSVNTCKILNHGYIVKYLDSFEGEQNGVIYVVMEYCEGGDLFSRMKKQAQEGFFEEKQILDWLVQLCLALEYIHNKQVIHRDIKPHNIFLLENGYLNLGDFESSKELDGPDAYAKSVVGTELYVSPEALQGRSVWKSEIWSLGWLLHDLCMLDVWSDAIKRRTAHALSMTGHLPQISDRYSTDLRELISEMLSPEPDQRPSAGEILGKPFLTDTVKRNKKIPEQYERQLQKAILAFDEAYTLNFEKFETLVDQWGKAVDSLEQINYGTTAGSLSGAAVGAAGGITAMVGAILAPFTFGTSLIVAGVGIGVGVAGGITGATSNFTKNVKQKAIIQKCEEIKAEFESVSTPIFDSLKTLRKVMKDIEKFKDVASSSNENNFQMSWRVGRATIVGVTEFITLGMLASFGRIAVQTAQVGRAVAAASGVLSGVLVIADIAFIVKDSIEIHEMRNHWKTDNPDQVKSQILKSIARMRKTHKDLDSAVNEIEKTRMELNEDIERVVGGEGSYGIKDFLAEIETAALYPAVVFKENSFSLLRRSSQTEYKLPALNFHRESTFIPAVHHTATKMSKLQEQSTDLDARRDQKLGEGTSGTAFKVTNKESDECVIKEIVCRNNEHFNRIKDSVNTCKILNHGYIVKYLDSFEGEQSGVIYVVMEYCEGGDLFSRMKKQAQEGFFEEEQILDWLVQLCLALEYIHYRQVIHRDIKPHNIFLAEYGNLNLGDFESSKELDGPDAYAKSVVGTELYVSPEALQGRSVWKSEIWSLGWLLHDLCMLDVWSDAIKRRTAHALSMTGHLPQISDRYSTDLRELISEMLSPEPDQRPSAGEILGKPFLTDAVQRNMGIPEKHERQLQKAILAFDEAYTLNFEKFETLVDQWGKAVDSLEQINYGTTAGSLSGAAVGAAGGITALVGAMLAPFTFGTSLIVAGVGIGVGVAGGITGATSNITKSVKQKTIIQRCEEIKAEFERVSTPIFDSLKALRKVMKDIEKFKDVASSSNENNFQMSWRVGRATIVGAGEFIALGMVASFGRMAVQTAKVGRAIAAASGILSGVLVIADIAFIVKDSIEIHEMRNHWKTDNPDQVKSQILKSIAQMRKTHKDLETAVNEIENTRMELNEVIERARALAKQESATQNK
ncbi:hypothetical protein DNTS_020647 [Danionella cerebrum]|uniref:non-specific serine/threonine protein kinase n=2 Tax=Danionella cerebrum TaxID=2873325 RepID=A0A553PZL7_9TELE|nr:hypothetical protein DNTS_020647 [Danionella translucida]